MSKRGTEETLERRRRILETTARLLCERGYDATGIQEIAEACDLTKAGLYHYFESKEALLHEIMSYGMDLFEEQVLSQVDGIVDPVVRLKTCMAKNVTLVTRGWSRGITIVLHEHAALHGSAGKQITLRKKKYVRFLEQSFAEAIAKGLIRNVNPTIAAFSFLGMVLWIYKWFRPDGALTDEQIAEGMTDLFFAGLEPRAVTAAPGARLRKHSRPASAAHRRSR